MAIDFQFHPAQGIVHVRFTGFVSVAETLERAAAYAAHPLAGPHLNQVIDFTETTGFERDYANLLAMLARLPDHLIRPGHEPLFIYVAPHALAQEMTGLVLKAMQGLPGPILRMVGSRAEALQILGLPDHALALT